MDRRGDRLINWQLSADAIRRRLEALRYAQMSAQHLAAISAFEVNDMVAPHRSPDRHYRLPRDRTGAFSPGVRCTGAI